MRKSDSEPSGQTMGSVILLVGLLFFPSLPLSIVRTSAPPFPRSAVAKKEVAKSESPSPVAHAATATAAHITDKLCARLLKHHKRGRQFHTHWN